MKKNLYFLLILPAVFAFCASLAQAQVYRCITSQGGVSFSDRPCSEGKQEVVDMRYKSDKREVIKPTEPAASSSTGSTKPEATGLGAKATPQVSEITLPPVKSSETRVPLEDRLAALCVDRYRPHLAYPSGVRIVGRTLEKSLSEMIMTVLVKTITNNLTPALIETITLTEKFICVTDGGSGLNLRSTGIYVDRHKGGQRL